MLGFLAYFGLPAVVSRCLFRRLDVRWVLLGCALPGLPRLMLACSPLPDVYDRYLYYAAQNSLLGALLLCAAAASIVPRPVVHFGVLAFSAVAHLLLDACPTRWGDGVAFEVPFSWRLLHFDLFWPEEWPALVATGVGALFLLFVARRELWQPLVIRARRWPMALVFVAAWGVFPLALMSSAYRANVRDVDALRQEHLTESLTFSRQPFDGELLGWNGESYRLWPAPADSGVVSLRGILAAPHEIVVEEIHLHGPAPHASLGFAGLALLAAGWLVGIGRARLQPSEC